jgi:hypothetical protein
MMSRTQLEYELQELRRAVGRRDLTEAVVALQNLVPGYSPSQRVMESVKRSSSQVPA